MSDRLELSMGEGIASNKEDLDVSEFSDEIVNVAILLKSVLNPKDDAYESSLLELGGLVAKGQLGKVRFVRACLAIGKEPYWLKDNYNVLGIFSEHLPRRTVKEAWKIVMDNKGLMVRLKRQQFGEDASNQGLDSQFAEKMFVAALYYDETCGITFSAFVKTHLIYGHDRIRTQEMGGPIRFGCTVRKRVRIYDSLISEDPHITDAQLAKKLKYTI